MKLINFRINGQTRAGVLVKENKVVDVNYAYQSKLRGEGKYRYEAIAEAFVPSKMEALLEGGKESLDLIQEVITYALENPEEMLPQFVFDLSEVKLEAPLKSPRKIVCVGHNYSEHIREMGRELPENPVIFAKFSNTIIGPEDDIPYYPMSEKLDYEAEFAFVIGEQARNVSEEKALNYVAGYTIVNDVTYRDFQQRTLQWLQGKSVDGTAPMGPYFVTTEELTDPSGLEIVLTVNGEERQRSNTANLVFTVPKLVHFLSGLMTLEPGDLILTGTPGGVGAARDPQAFLKDGDIVKIEVDQLGTLENTVKLQEEKSIRESVAVNKGGK